jgi:hypothetical protein
MPRLPKISSLQQEARLGLQRELDLVEPLLEKAPDDLKLIRRVNSLRLKILGLRRAEQKQRDKEPKKQKVLCRLCGKLRCVCRCSVCGAHSEGKQYCNQHNPLR